MNNKGWHFGIWDAVVVLAAMRAVYELMKLKVQSSKQKEEENGKK